MRAPLTLLIPVVILAYLVPFICTQALANQPVTKFSALAVLAIPAIVPLVTALVAYGQGYRQGLQSSSRKPAGASVQGKEAEAS